MQCKFLALIVDIYWG